MNYKKHDVYLVTGYRTPFLKFKANLGEFSATDLAVFTVKEILQQCNLSPDVIGEIIAGCVFPSVNEANIARIIALRSGCHHKIPAWTAQRNCASSLQAIDSAFKDIQLGRHDLIIAGGTEAMSRAPLVYNNQATRWFSNKLLAKTSWQKFLSLLNIPIGQMTSPISSVVNGLIDPTSGLIMGETAEILIKEFNINRKSMDEYALHSHQRASKYFLNNKDKAQEIVNINDKISFDTGIRPSTTLKQLSKLNAVFKINGSVTAGNSSQLSDGACFILFANKKALKKYNLQALAKILDISWAGCDPKKMGLGPIYAMTPLLKRNNYQLKNIDYFEINEAFAGQVLACINAWQDEEFCKTYLQSDIIGKIDKDHLNINGGAIAIGHPVGASGARVTLHLAYTLKEQNVQLGIASLCVGGGQGGAILLEKI